MSKTRSTFRSQLSYRRFASNSKHANPYFRDPEDEEFLKTLLKSAKTREKVFKSGEIFWRAQLGYDWMPNIVDNVDIGDHVPIARSRKRMKPRRNKAKEGRANPKGIPYLYCASDANTAMAELRPWMNQYISVAQFVIARDLTVVDCISKDPNQFPIYYFDDPGKEPSPKKREQYVWSSIDRAFSNPVTPTDDLADYVPTQIIAGWLKNAGYDGVKYRSSVGKGFNIVLFNVDDAELKNCSLMNVGDISYSFENQGSGYVVTKSGILNDKELKKEVNNKMISAIKKRDAKR